MEMRIISLTAEKLIFSDGNLARFREKKAPLFSFFFLFLSSFFLFLFFFLSAADNGLSVVRKQGRLFARPN